MAAVAAGLRLIYRCMVAAISLAMIYAVFEVLRQGEANPTARALLLGVGVLALAWAAAAWSRRVVASYVQVFAISLLAGFYLFELWYRAPIEEMLHIEQFWRLAMTKAASGQPFTIQFSPDNFTREPNGGIDLPTGERIFPLGQVADLPTIMCREGERPFAEFEADERGFNNPKGIWGRPVDVMFIGDSMTYGACLPNRDHFIAQIRERFPSTLNLGVGGVGPLFALAHIREFVPKIKPKYIFYMYDENNDLYFLSPTGDADIVREYGNPILRKYLADDQFSQRIYERQSEINAALKQIVDNTMASALAQRTPLRSLLRLLGLPSMRAGLRSLPPIEPAAPIQNPHPVDPGERHSEADIGEAAPAIVRVAAAAEQQSGVDYFEVFREIFSKMVQVSSEAGARFVFVNIPAYQTVCDSIDHPWKRRVLDFVRKSGVDFIDLESDFRNADKTVGREALFAVPPCGGHFSETGYKVIGDRLVQYLEIQEKLANSDGPGGIVPDGWRLTTSRELVYGGTALSESELLKGRRRMAARMREPSVGVLARTFEDAQRWVIRKTSTGRDFYHEQIYQSYGKVDRAVNADAVVDVEAASIMGYGWTPKSSVNLVRVTVVVPAWTDRPTSIVAALFVNQSVVANKVASQELVPGKVAEAVLEFEMVPAGIGSIGLNVRVGVGRPGVVYLNGNANGPDPDMPKPRLTIEEYRPFWR
jgi:hypothetical protein